MAENDIQEGGSDQEVEDHIVYVDLLNGEEHVERLTLAKGESFTSELEAGKWTVAVVGIGHDSHLRELNSGRDE